MHKLKQKINKILEMIMREEQDQSSNGQEGYTLIEVVVTILIMGMILIMVNMVLISLIRVSYDTDARMNVRQDVEFGLEVIRRDTKSADPAQISATPSNQLDLVLSGSGERIRFRIIQKDGIGTLRSEWLDRNRYINLTSPEEVDVEEFNVGYYHDNTSGTGEIIITIRADSVQTKVNGDPVVDDFYKQVSIITKGQEL
jgi:prepilin-type N-terminal cleavage/methylation domain-containing protein